MAAILEALASYVQNMLTEMAKEEVHMLLGVSSEIDNLGVKLGDLKNFLADADRRNITDQSVQGWVKELKSAMYDATDIIDQCQLKAMKRGPSMDVGCFNPMFFCVRNPLFAHDIGSSINRLNERLGNICKRGGMFDFIKLETYQYRRAACPALANRWTHPVLERSSVVGEKIQEDTRVLVEKLTMEGEAIMVVAIVGVGGIGKTTLAKNIYNDEVIQDEFQKKIWLSITQEFNEAELLRTAITAANGDLPGSNQDKALLVLALENSIRNKKFFLVLDDMWSDGVWNNLLKAPFSHGASCSRVLLTTRHEAIARRMKAVPPYYHVNMLGLEDAWSLLKKQVVSSEIDELEIETLKDVAMKIIEKCGGLPLAIKVMGGLLCQREKRRGSWDKVLDDTIWSISQMPEELNYAIYLSYEDLSPCLKQCFLHYSLLPRNTEFSVDTIVGMWISEGFIHGNSCELEDSGGEYYRELISRNLIEPDTSYADQWFCNMHDVVRSFAQYIAREETLVAHNGKVDIDSELNPRMFLRLSIETLDSAGVEWRVIQEHKSLRTLVLTGQLKIQPGDSLIPLSSLRTLHIESANIYGLADTLSHLKYLRYLSLRFTDVPRLPENIGNMRFLQHISLLGSESLVKLPNSLVKLSQLRYLSLPTSIISIPRGFHVLTNLRKLYWFPTHMNGDWCSLEELGPLIQLRQLSIIGLESVCASSFATKAKLGEKVHLTSLILNCTSRLGDNGRLATVEDGAFEQKQQMMEMVFNELCPLPCLEYLGINGYFSCQLPRWMTSTAVAPLTSLRILFMEDLACCTELPDGLCQLPFLEYLEINRAPAITYVGAEFLKTNFHHRHNPSRQMASAFPRLHKLKFKGMLEWEKWEWEWQQHMHAMSILQELLISNCKLRCVPPGLASHARVMKCLTVTDVQHLNALENFGSVIELCVKRCPELRRISNFPKLHKLVIVICPKMKELVGVAALHRLELEDYDMETLPGYMRDVNPRHFLLDCSELLLSAIAAGKSCPEWVKFSHIQQVKAYAGDGDITRKWYVLYTRDPFNIDTNISRSAIVRAHLKRIRFPYLTSPIGDEWPIGRQPLCERLSCSVYFSFAGWLRQVCPHCNSMDTRSNVATAVSLSPPQINGTKQQEAPSTARRKIVDKLLDVATTKTKPKIV